MFEMHMTGRGDLLACAGERLAGGGGSAALLCAGAGNSYDARENCGDWDGLAACDGEPGFKINVWQPSKPALWRWNDAHDP